jgi:hypothetical protein
MLDTIFCRPHHIRRMRAGPLGSLFDPLAEFLLHRGYSDNYIHQILRATEHFGYWLQTQQETLSADAITKISTRRSP